MATDFIQGTLPPGRPGTESYQGGYSLDNTIPKNGGEEEGVVDSRYAVRHVLWGCQ